MQNADGRRQMAELKTLPSQGFSNLKGPNQTADCYPKRWANLQRHVSTAAKQVPTLTVKELRIAIALNRLNSVFFLARESVTVS